MLLSPEEMGTKMKDTSRHTWPCRTSSGYRRVNQEKAPLVRMSPTKTIMLPMATYFISSGMPKLGCL